MKEQANFIVRGAIALVWFYHGVMNKLLAGSGSHSAIVSAVPFFDKTSAPLVLTAIALLEIGLGCWILSGSQSRLCSIVQTCSLISMNAGGLFWSRQLISDPPGMIVNNLVFLTLIWFFEFARAK